MGGKKEDRSRERELEEKCGGIKARSRGRDVDGKNSDLFLGWRPAPQQCSERSAQRRQTGMGRKGWGRGNVRHKGEYKRKPA